MKLKDWGQQTQTTLLTDTNEMGREVTGRAAVTEHFTSNLFKGNNIK